MPTTAAHVYRVTKSQCHTKMILGTLSMHLQAGMVIISMNHKLSIAGLTQGCHHSNRFPTKPWEAATKNCNHCSKPWSPQATVHFQMLQKCLINFKLNPNEMARKQSIRE